MKHLIQKTNAKMVVITFITIILGFIRLMVSCGPKPSFIEERLKVENDTNISGEAQEDNATASIQSINSESINIKKINTNTYLLDVKSSQTVIPTEKPPVELIFILDNSDSMSFNIEKLKQSSQNLFTQLKESKIPYSVRILTLDMLLNQLVDFNSIKVPEGLFAGNIPSYQRSNNLYNSVESYNDLDQVQYQFLSKLDTIQNQLQNIDNEPGVCLALDYINWALNQQIAKLSTDKKWHFIALSNENNSRKYNIYDLFNPTPTPLASKDLVCYQKKVTEKKCQEIPSKTKYLYSYQEPQISYTYKYNVTYKKRGYCQKLGYVQDNEEDTLNELWVNKRCVTNQYRCENFWNVLRYSCSISSLSLSEIVSEDYSQGLSQRTNCKVASTFSCQQYVDGREKWVIKNRADAISLINRGITCVPKDWQGRQAFLATDALLKTPDKYGIQDCHSYSCSPIQVENTSQVTILESQLDSSKYRNCKLIKSNASPISLYTLNKDSLKRLTSIKQLNSCPNFYRLQTLSTQIRLDSTYFCGSNLNNVSIPEGIIIKQIGLSKTSNKFTSISSSTKLTKAQIAARIGIKESDIIKVEESVTTVNTYKTINLGPFDNQVYPEGHPFREGKLNFKEIVQVDPARTDCKDEIVEQKIISPSPENFISLMKDLYPKANITWHSIVNTTGQKCKADNNTEVISKGEDYIALSQMTGGKIYDICEDSYQKFVDEVKDVIVTEVITNYAIPKELQNKKIISVFNASTKIDLKKGTDWWISENTLIFNKNLINTGDKIIIKFIE